MPCYVIKMFSIGSGNMLLPNWLKAVITWTNIDLLLYHQKSFGPYFNETGMKASKTPVSQEVQFQLVFDAKDFLQPW